MDVIPNSSIHSAQKLSFSEKLITLFYYAKLIYTYILLFL